MRRMLVPALPLLAVAAVLLVVVDSEHRRVAAVPPAAHAAAEPPTTPVPKPAIKRHRRRLHDALRGSAARTAAIPILMYHVIGTPTAATPNVALWVTPTLFVAQMTALKRAGYQAITLGQAWNAWTKGTAIPRRPVVISFDDGYPGDYKTARPELVRLGWRGILNVAIRDIGAKNLSARMVRGLIAAGWEIDSHTINHPDMTAIGPAEVEHELVGSRAILLHRFGVHARFFCYPFGRYDAGVEAAVKAAGYLAAETEDEGYATPTDPFALKRVRVKGGETPATLLAQLRAERPVS